MRTRLVELMGVAMVFIGVSVLLKLAPAPVAGPTSLASFVAVAEASGPGAQTPTASADPATKDNATDFVGVEENPLQ